MGILARALAAPPDRNFPFSSGQPVRLTARRGAIILAGCAVAFAALLATPHLIYGRAGGWLGVALFVAIQLAGLALATGPGWRAIYRRPTFRDVGLGLAFAPLTFLTSAVVALVLMTAGLTADNPIGQMMAAASGVDLGLYFASTGVQLMGEELVTVLPFLVILAGLQGAGVGRRVAIVAAWVATALIFGALHLPTYQWHLAQSLLVIGAARLVLTAPFLITRNIWSSYVAHLANDWSLFAVIVLLPR